LLKEGNHVLKNFITHFGQIYNNPVLLDHSVTAPVCEGLNVALASFQGLYLQYQKHHFVVEGAFYQLHQFFNELRTSPGTHP